MNFSIVSFAELYREEVFKVARSVYETIKVVVIIVSVIFAILFYGHEKMIEKIAEEEAAYTYVEELENNQILEGMVEIYY